MTDEPAEVISRAAAIDVAKGSGMVCTRVPHEASSHRLVRRVWQVSARYADVVALMDELVSVGIQRLVIESTSDYWRIWYYLDEAAGLQVWLVNARDAKHLPGRPKTDKLDCVWLCKLNERGMLRRSFVPPEAIRDLRALTRLRSRLAADSARHQNRIEKILEDALLKISAVISDLMGQSGRRFLAALVAGQRDPKTLAALGDRRRLKASTTQLEAALTGRFRAIHALEIGMLLELIDGLTAQITRLDEKITAALAVIPGIAPACTGCGEIGGTHGPGCAGAGNPVLSVIERLDEITSIAVDGAQILIAELGTDMTVFPTPGHAAAWAKLTSRTIQSGATSSNGRTGKDNPYLRAVLGRAAMAAAKTDTYLGERYRRIARRRGKQKAIVAVARTICEIACMIIADPSVRSCELGPDYYARLDAGRQTRNRIRELERLNPDMKVTSPPQPRPPDPSTPAISYLPPTAPLPSPSALAAASTGKFPIREIRWLPGHVSGCPGGHFTWTNSGSECLEGSPGLRRMAPARGSPALVGLVTLPTTPMTRGSVPGPSSGSGGSGLPVCDVFPGGSAPARAGAAGAGLAL